jgi:hypothetical protein
LKRAGMRRAIVPSFAAFGKEARVLTRPSARAMNAAPEGRRK